jgi:hypothetical protein
MVDRADDVELSSRLALVDSGRLHRTFRLRHVSQPVLSAYSITDILTYSGKPWTQNDLACPWA